MTTSIHGFVPPYIEDRLPEPQVEHTNEGRERRSAGPSDMPGPTPSAPMATGTGRREVFDSEHKYEQRVSLAQAEGDPTTADSDVTFAYDYSGLVRGFLSEVFGRNSIDGTGLDLVLNVHFGEDYNNAFWDGLQMTFGDGDGQIFGSFAASLDVVAHELAHGVTSHTSNLRYQDQSGALNEHMSDVLGIAVTQWAAGESAGESDWLIGDEIMAPQLYGEALRCMAHPGTAYDNDVLGKDPQPAHMSDAYTGTGDNGGVHINSGIPNRAFYLVATELDDTIGVMKVWYHALRHMGPNTDFAEAASIVAQSARVLAKAGTVVKHTPQTVRAAFREVGI